MNQILKDAVLVMVMLLSCAVAYVNEDSSLDAYALMQNCMAEAVNVADNGSYERYCMDAYQLAVKSTAEK